MDTTVIVNAAVASMKKVSTYRRVLLFSMGLLIEIVGFLISHEKDIPVIGNLIYAKPNALKHGFNSICRKPTDLRWMNYRQRGLTIGKGELLPGDKGFKELTSFLLADINRDEPKYFHETHGSDMSFDMFKRRANKGEIIKYEFRGVLTGNVLPWNNSIAAILQAPPPGKDGEFWVYALKDGIDTYTRATLYTWSTFFFIIGICIQLTQFPWGQALKKN